MRTPNIDRLSLGPYGVFLRRKLQRQIPPRMWPRGMTAAGQHIFSAVANERLHTAGAFTMCGRSRAVEQRIIKPNDRRIGVVSRKVVTGLRIGTASGNNGPPDFRRKAGNSVGTHWWIGRHDRDGVTWRYLSGDCQYDQQECGSSHLVPLQTAPFGERNPNASHHLGAGRARPAIITANCNSNDAGLRSRKSIGSGRPTAYVSIRQIDRVGF